MAYMSKKSERLDVIRKLISSERISSQEELLALLRKEGIEATQSTLSRDMKELRAIKIPDPERGYIYLLSETFQGERMQEKMSATLTDNIRYIDFTGNMLVIRTTSGYARAVGVMIDNEEYRDVIGTVAGDDTLLVVLSLDVSPLEFLDTLDAVHPDIKLLYNPDRRNGYAKRGRM